MEARFKRLKIACEIAKAHLFLKPGELAIRTEDKAGNIIKVERITS